MRKNKDVERASVSKETDRALAPHWRREDNLGRAVMFIVLAAVLLPMLNAGAKYLADRYPIIEITFARYAGHFLYMIIAFAPLHGRALMKSSMPGVQIFRSTLLCASTLLFIAGLRYLTLPTATAISFTAPIIVTALSPLMLREHVGPWRWGAVAAGFVGALVIVRPGASENWAGLLTLAGAFSAALYQIVSRRFAGRDSVATSITYMALVGFVLTAIPLPFVWQTPASLWDVVVFLSLGLFGGFGHYFLVRAFELAPAPTIAPFNYVQLVTASGVAYAIFGHLPDAWTWIGATIIVASGILILHRERVRARRP
jgi:drug/metabolite transporter (DMT)-like permease